MDTGEMLEIVFLEIVLVKKMNYVDGFSNWEISGSSQVNIIVVLYNDYLFL